MAVVDEKSTVVTENLSINIMFTLHINGFLSSIPEQTVPRYWYDVSVLVKMDFDELKRVDPKLLNHSRLLHSMV